MVPIFRSAFQRSGSTRSLGFTMAEDAHGTLPGVLHYTSRSRAERVVAASRLVLAAFTLLAIWLDPSQPAKYADVTYALMVVYVAYSALLVVAVWFSRAPLAHVGLATHVADLAIFSLFMYLTEGPGSPFFSYFTFAVVAGALRWQWRGAVWTALAALLSFNGMGVYASQVLRDPTISLNRFIIRSVYLAVLAALLGYLGAHEARLRGELAGLASWPRTLPADLPSVLESDLGVAARLLRVPRVLLVWEDPDEPWLRAALWYRGGLEQWRESPDTWQPIVDESLTDAPFLTTDPGASVSLVSYASASGLRVWRGSPVNTALQARFAVGAVVSLPIRTEHVTGRLFALDSQQTTADDLVLGGIVARQISASLDHYYLTRRLREAAATEERVRLSRDLHDGVLQWLTGAALQLQTMEQLFDRDPTAARGVLGTVRQLVADEQRDLRFYIQDLKPTPLDAHDIGPGLDATVNDLALRLEGVWGVHVEVDPPQLDGVVPPELVHDVYRLIQEASVNAARHGRATAVRASLERREGILGVTVTDNGRGFGFHGRFDQKALAERQLGPRTLRERVSSLGGALSLESSPTGSRIEMVLPVGPRPV